MRFVRLLFVCAALAFAGTAALALPTVEAVQAEVQRGNWTQAETMMQEVIAARPGSARAHYVYAEILAHNRHFDRAAAEAARARQIDPAVRFADPAKFAALEQSLQRVQSAAHSNATTPAARAMPVGPATAAPTASAASGVPTWVWVLGLAGIAAIVFVVVNRRQQATSSMMMAPVPTAGPYAAPGASMPVGAAGWGQSAPSRGAGLMGVGLAAAGGVAAGMLAERLLHGGHEASAAGSAGSPPANGLVPGMFDDGSEGLAAERELEQRPIDFGRGDEWGGDAGGSFDAGGGGDDNW